MLGHSEIEVWRLDLSAYYERFLFQYMSSSTGFIGWPSCRDLGVSNLVEQRLEPCSMYSFRVTGFDE